MHFRFANWLAERIFDWAGTPVTHLRPTVFNEWLLYMRNGIREGKYALPFGRTGRFAPISADDQGAVIAEILANPAPHTGRTYPLRSRRADSPEIAEIVAQTLGKEGSPREIITSEQWVRNVNGQDIPFLAQHLREIAFDQENGLAAGTNDIVERIAGRRPMTVAEFVEKHRKAFQ